MVRLLMANPAEIAEIPLAGRGHTQHLRRGYAPGEYKTLANCEILEDGTIMNRRPVGSVHTAAFNTATTTFKNIHGFMGNYKHNVIIAGLDCHKMLTAEGQLTVDLWPVSSLQTGLDVANNEWRRIVAFHRYNKTNYWITQCWFYNGGSANCDIEYALYYAKDPVGGDISGIAFASLTKVVIFRTTVTVGTGKDDTRSSVFKGQQHPTFAPTENGNPAPAVTPESFPQFRTSFIHKDRLWLFTDLKCYFSKTGDPTVWLAPDGGMFNFLEYQINDAVGHRDSIYIACDSSVFALNYTSDPNTNSTLKQLSSTQGGDSICLSGDTVYFARDDGLFSVSDQTITRVLELDVFAAPTSFNYNSPEWRLISVNDYIIAWLVQAQDSRAVVFPTYTKFNPKTQASWPTYKYIHEICPYYSGSGVIGNTSQHGVFFINTKNGSISAFSITQDALFQSFYFVAEEDGRDNQVVYFLTEKGSYVGGGGVRYTVHWPHYISWSLDEIQNNSVYDRVQYDDAQLVSLPVPWDIEISDYSPDGSEHFNKRFRSLVIEGDLRYHVEFRVAYDDENFLAPVVLNTTPAGIETTFINNINRTPVPLRFPLNQRSKSISLRLSRGGLIPPLTVNKEFSGMSIRRISLFWTPTARGVLNRNTPV